MTIWQITFLYLLPLAIYIMLDLRFERPRLNSLVDAILIFATITFVHIGMLWGFESNVVAILFVIVFWQLREISINNKAEEDN